MPGPLLAPRVRLALGLALIAALASDFFLYTGFFASDDIGYWTSAEMVVKGTDFAGVPEFRPWLSLTRLGMTLPDSLIYWLSDGDIHVGAWCFLFYHLALVVVAFALGRLLHGDRAGLLAAFLAATSPVLGVYAGAVLPDNATALWLGLALLAVELARRRMTDPASSARRVFPSLFAAGLLIGVAYMVKETAIIMVVPAAACVIAAAPRLRDPVWIRNGAFMAAGLAVVLVVELLLLRAVTGEWVFRLGGVEGSGESMEFRMEEQGGANPIARLWYALDARLLPIGPVSTLLLLAGAVAYLFLRERNLAVVLFFWWPLIYVTVGSTSFTSYLPPSIQVRYYSIVILPGAVMEAAAGLALLRRWRAWERPPAWARGAWAGVALVAALVLVAGYELDGNASRGGTIYAAERARGFEVTYERARTRHPQYPIVLSRYYSRRMRPLWLRDWNEVYAGTFGGATTPPDPPYLYLESRRELRAAPGRNTHEAVAGLEIRTLEVVEPPRSRRVILAAAVRELFGLRPERDPPGDIMAAGVIQLVTRAGGDGGLEPDREMPLVPSKEAPPVVDTDPGHIVEWPRGARPDFSLHAPEGGSYRVAPTNLAAQLPAGTRSVRASVDVRLVRGGPTRILLTAFTYPAGGGEPVRGKATARLTARAAPQTLAVELAAPEPLTAFRLRLEIKSGSGWPGTLHVGDPRVEVLPAPAP